MGSLQNNNMYTGAPGAQWQEARDPASGKPYWYNAAGETTWDPPRTIPAPVPTPAPAPAMPAGAGYPVPVYHGQRPAPAPYHSLPPPSHAYAPPPPQRSGGGGFMTGLRLAMSPIFGPPT